LRAAGAMMNITSAGRALVLLLAGLIAGVHTASASDDTLARAKGLYASAAYDEALAVLDRLQSETPAEDPTSIAEYRVFCLLALDRRDEARKNIERILHDNPLYLPSADQASPRIQSVFRDVRRQSLPKIVLERYAAAKAAFERKDSSAGQQFDDVVALLADPDLQNVSALTDLREVASAFRDLTKALAAPAAPVADARTIQQTVIPQQQTADIIYTSANADVIPPVAQSQRVPPWRPSPNEAVREFKGALRLVIDRSGAVESATMSASTRPAYDPLLLKAARGWKFEPARKQGTPVRYLKLIEIRLEAGTP
jgi:tetratricopeptide (TPR) repeat protein